MPLTYASNSEHIKDFYFLSRAECIELVVGEKLTLNELSQQGIPSNEIFGRLVSRSLFRTTEYLHTIAEIMVMLMLLKLVHSKSRVFFG